MFSTIVGIISQVSTMFKVSKYYDVATKSQHSLIIEAFHWSLTYCT